VTRDIRPVWAEVDLDAIAHNVRVVRSWCRPGVAVTVSLKVDGYGHGAFEIARELDALAVPVVMTESLDEARRMVDAGFAADVVLLGSALPAAISDCLDAGVIPTVCAQDSLAAVSALGYASAKIFVKVDSGLGRLGVPVEDAAAFVRRCVAASNVQVAGIYTHLPFADDDGRRWAESGLERFAAMVSELRDVGIEPPVVQAMSSPGVLAGLDHPAVNAVCVGAIVYGISPLSSPTHDPAELRRALAGVYGRIIHVSRHSARRRAGSGGVRTYAEGAVTGVVPIGLGDGYGPGMGTGGLEMLIDGIRVPVLGITMAHTTVDLTAIDDPSIGQRATLVGIDDGEEITLEEVAARSGTTPVGVVLRLRRRICYDHLRLGGRVAPSVAEIVSY
jgi:alanine racemase